MKLAWKTNWARVWQNQKWPLHTVKTQFSLGIQSDQSPLCAQWVAKDPNLLQADSKESEQTGWMPRLIRVFTGHTDHFAGFVKIGLKFQQNILKQWCWWFEPWHDKTNKMSVRPVKTQISLGIRPVWSEPLLSAWRKLGSLATHWAHSEDSDQTGRLPRLICLRWAHTHFVGFVAVAHLVVFCHFQQLFSLIWTMSELKGLCAIIRAVTGQCSSPELSFAIKI